MPPIEMVGIGPGDRRAGRHRHPHHRAQQRHHGRRDHSTAVAEARFGALTQGGDYSLVAKGLGAWSERATQTSDIIPALRRAIDITQSGHPAVLEFITKAETAASRPMAG